VRILISKKMDAKYAAGYIVAQILGAILASALLLLIVKGAPGGYDPSVAGFAANGWRTLSRSLQPALRLPG